jgi:hypothetical protein
MPKLKRDPEKEPGYLRMKKALVIREGREEEFAMQYQALSVSDPDWSIQKRQHRAYELMGITNELALQRWRDVAVASEGNEAERRTELAILADEARREEQKREDIEKEEAARLEAERQRTQREFERAFRGLPLEADRQTVLRWIENHPAMVLGRPVNEDGLVELTVADIEDAPSRSAVGQLQHWVNNKEKFYIELMKRKPSDDAEAEDGEETEEEGLARHDPTLADVMKMLDEIGC